MYQFMTHSSEIAGHPVRIDRLHFRKSEVRAVEIVVSKISITSAQSDGFCQPSYLTSKTFSGNYELKLA